MKFPGILEDFQEAFREYLRHITELLNRTTSFSNCGLTPTNGCKSNSGAFFFEVVKVLYFNEPVSSKVPTLRGLELFLNFKLILQPRSILSISNTNPCRVERFVKSLQSGKELVLSLELKWGKKY